MTTIDRKNSVRIALPLVIVLAAAGALLPTSGAARRGGEAPVGEWEMTPEAAARTANGDCQEEFGENGVCLEWCLSTDQSSWGTGVFDCFPG